MTSRLPEPASRSRHTPDGRMIQHGRPQGSEHVATAIRDDVVRVTRAGPIVGSACMKLPGDLAWMIRSLTRPCNSRSTGLGWLAMATRPIAYALPPLPGRNCHRRRGCPGEWATSKSRWNRRSAVRAVLWKPRSCGSRGTLQVAADQKDVS